MTTRRIGLSLGADLCWPLCFERILDRLDLAIPIGDDTIRFETERVTIEPFDLRQPVRYDVVLDIGAGYEIDRNRMWSVVTALSGIVLTAAFWAALLLL